MVESRKISLRFTICINSHLGPPTAAKSLDLCSWQSNPMIPVNQRLSRGKTRGLGGIRRRRGGFGACPMG